MTWQGIPNNTTWVQDMAYTTASSASFIMLPSLPSVAQADASLGDREWLDEQVAEVCKRGRV